MKIVSSFLILLIFYNGAYANNNTPVIILSMTPSHNCFTGDQLEEGRKWWIKEKEIIVQKYKPSGKPTIVFYKRTNKEKYEKIAYELSLLNKQFWDYKMTKIAGDGTETVYRMSGTPVHRVRWYTETFKHDVTYNFIPDSFQKVISEFNVDLPKKHQIKWKLRSTTN